MKLSIVIFKKGNIANVRRLQEGNHMHEYNFSSTYLCEIDMQLN